MGRFLLTTTNADAWRGLLLSGRATPSLADCDGVTLAGALELLATAVALRECSDLFQCLTAVADTGHPLWHELMAEWASRERTELTGDLHGTRRREFFRLRTIEDKTSLGFSLFLERFCRSLKAQDFPKEFANALAQVMDEMADNVLQHSGPIADGFSGIGGYHVEANRAGFAVVDIGCGILSSLNGSSTWKHLSTARDALRAIVAEGASSRTGQGPGEGFKQLFASLIDHNALVRLRSDDSVLIVADGRNEREGGELRSPILRGVQVSVSCATGVRAVESKMMLD